tara:strand:+ start:98 stop:712 length:615 start_codon:yes stop_codon:yes gene_type:complete
MPESQHCANIFIKPEVLSRTSSFKVVTLTPDGVGHGSGAYVDYRGKHYVLTAHHVIEDALSVMVMDEGGAHNAFVLIESKEKDLAFLALEREVDKNSIPLATIKRVDPKVFENVMYTGFPNLTGPLTIQGIISGYSEDGSLILQSYAWMGASGSVILNEKGQIVGVLNGIELARGISGEYVANSTIVLANQVPVSVLEILDFLE